MSGGRPTNYDPETLDLVRKVAQLGATDVEIADVLGVDARTLYRWRHKHPEFAEALKVGKEVADAKVEESLYRRATGYSHQAVKIFMPAGADKPVYAEYTEHHAPDTTACIFWLKNRRPSEWRDRREIAGDPDNPLHVVTDTVDRPPDETREQWLARRARELAARTRAMGGPAGAAD